MEAAEAAGDTAGYWAGFFGLVSALGGIAATLPLPANLKALGLALNLGGALAKEVISNRDAIGSALNDLARQLGELMDDLPDIGGDPFTGMPWPGVISPTLGTTPDPLVKTIRYVDPLILDLDGDGLEITPLAAGVLFDANGDTIKTGTAWVGADDGMLVWDRDGIYDPTPGKLNVLRFKDGVAPSDVIAKQVYDGYYGYTALELSIAGTTDKAFISGFFYGNNPEATGANPIQQVEFADGTIWDMQSILAKVYAGTDGDDTLTGTIGNDNFSDSSGNDMLAGGLGNDNYRFGRNSGQDVISDYDASAGNADTVSFGPDVSAEQLWFQRQDNNLEVSIIGTNDRLSIANWYVGDAYKVEEFRTSNGAMTIESQVQNLIQAMASFAPPAMGQTHLSPDVRSSLEMVLAASWR